MGVLYGRKIRFQVLILGCFLLSRLGKRVWQERRASRVAVE